MDDDNPEIQAEGQRLPTDSDVMARHVFIWRSRGLTADAKSIDEMVAALEGAADALRLLREAGVVLDVNASAGDDACLVTTDAAVAKRYAFQREAAKAPEKCDSGAESKDSADAKVGE